MQQQSLSQLDHAFVAMLYQRHAATILLHVRRRVFSWEDAEDIVLEVFLAALEQENKLSTLEDAGQLAWLRRVAHNKVIDLYRRSARHTILVLDEVADTVYLEDDQVPEQLMLLHEERTVLQAYLAGLPPQQQEILQLRFAAGLRCKDIATLLNKREGTVRSLLSRSLNFLRTIYEKQ
jgi:RNA polymerase sigma factor (sigma-70 family)